MGRMFVVEAVALLAVGAWMLLRPKDEPVEAPPPSAAHEEPAKEETPRLVALPPESAAAKPAAQDTRPAPADPRRREVVGRVVDGKKQPVPGASVSLAAAGAVSAASVTTDAEGRFLLEATLEPGTTPVSARVEAERDGLRGYMPVGLRSRPSGSIEFPARLDVGDVELRESHAIDVVVDSDCPGAPPATVWVMDRGVTPLPLARVDTDGAGRVRIDGLPPGHWRVVASATGCGRASAFVKVPSDTGAPVELRIPVERVVTVEVVDKETSAPIAGAVVSVLELVRRPGTMEMFPLGSQPSEVTCGPDGRAVIRGLAESDYLLLSASAEGYPAQVDGDQGAPSSATALPKATEARIQLAKARTIRWPVKSGAVPAPPDGAVVRLSAHTNSGILVVPPEGRMEGGDLVVAGWGPGFAAAYAHAPDGSVARLHAKPDAVVGTETEFFPRRTIVVVLHESDGGPAAGWAVQAFDQGNNGVKPPSVTDEKGEARIEDLYGGPYNLVDVRIAPPTGRPAGILWGGEAIGSVNLSQGDGRIVLTLPEQRRLTVRVRLDGRPGLPEKFGVTVGGRAAEVVESAAETGVAVVLHRAKGGPLAVQVGAAGWVGGAASVAATAVEVEVDLQRAAALRVKILPLGRRDRIGLDRYDERTSTWGFASRPNMHMSGGPSMTEDEEGLRFSGLVPGKYRAVDALSGALSPEVAVVAAEPPVLVVFDLRGTGYVKGRVEVPAGYSVAGASVGVEGETPDPMAVMMGRAGTLTARVDASGEFSLPVPGDKTFRIRAFHPTLVAAAEGGVVEVREPREGVVLRLVAGATARFRFSRAVTPTSPMQRAAIPVLLFTGPLSGPPAERLTATITSDGISAELGGFRPGKYTMWIDASPYVPILREVEFIDVVNDLGEIEVSEGAAFVLEVIAKEGQSAPRYHLSVTSQGAPSYVRSVSSFTATTIRVPGIGAGRFRVLANPYSGGGAALDEEIEFDGRTEVRRTLDLR